MLAVLWRIPFFMMMRRFGRPRMLPLNVTISPSSRCNSRCLTCNIWKRRDDEMSLSEWDQIFQGLGRAPYWFTISGGEPFLRDIVPIARSIYKHCRPGIINIPTNSLPHNTIPSQVQQICENCPGTQVIINLSLDGVGEKHDRIRGVPGAFDRFLANYRALRELNCSNLTIGIHSVISKFNIADVPELFDFALGLKPDSYITEIAEQRVELGTMGLPIAPTAEEYSRVIDELSGRIRKGKFDGISRITEAFRVRYYRLVKQVLLEERQVIPCYAGWASVQIYTDGQVWPCCVRGESIGNLRDVSYQLKNIWFSPEADRVRRGIAAGECHCPLANAGYTNMLMHPPTLAAVAAKVALG